jgi:hypothetical protein
MPPGVPLMAARLKAAKAFRAPAQGSHAPKSHACAASSAGAFGAAHEARNTPPSMSAFMVP